MGIEEIKELMQEILSSYESRISTVGIIMDNTPPIFEDFKTKINSMSNQLREKLANEESLRKKDFDNMMRNIFASQEEKEREVRDLLRDFLEEQKETAKIIKNELTEDKKLRIDNFRKMLEHIQTRQKAQEEELIIRLNEFQKGYSEIAGSMRGLLDKGGVIQIKDFKEMLKKIRSRPVRNEFLNGSRQAWIREEKGGDRAIEKEEVMMV